MENTFEGMQLHPLHNARITRTKTDVMLSKDEEYVYYSGEWRSVFDDQEGEPYFMVDNNAIYFKPVFIR